MSRVFKGQKYTKYILVFGTCSKEWVRFASSLCSIRYTVMIYDACVTREVFLSSVAAPDQKTVRLRDKIYTTDLEYMLEQSPRYDLVLIYDDFSQYGNYAKYESLLDYGYICCSATQYSISKMYELCEAHAKNPHYPFTFVFDGDKEEALEWDVLEHWKYLTTRRRKAEEHLFIPRCEENHNSYLGLEFGRFCYGELSQPLQAFLLDVVTKVAGNRPVVITAEPILGV